MIWTDQVPTLVLSACSFVPHHTDQESSFWLSLCAKPAVSMHPVVLLINVKTLTVDCSVGLLIEQVLDSAEPVNATLIDLQKDLSDEELEWIQAIALSNMQRAI